MNRTALRDQVLAALRNASTPLGLPEILAELGGAYRTSRTAAAQVLECLTELTQERSAERILRWHNRTTPSWRMSGELRDQLDRQTWIWP